MRKHAFDPASFVLGLVLSGIALTYLIAAAQDRTVQAAWVLPLTLIGLGLAAVAAGLSRAFRRAPAGAPGTADPTEPTSPAHGDGSDNPAPAADLRPDEAEV